VHRVRLAVLSLILLLWATPAQAGTVAILRPPRPNPDLTDTLSRLHGELLSVGLEVKMIDRPADRGEGQTDSRAWLEEIAAGGQIDAVIDIVGDTAPLAVDVWVIQKSPRRFEISRVALEPNTTNPSERLAIRAIEVLRSTFLEHEMAARKRGGEPVAEPATTTLPQGELPKPVSPRERFGLEVGAAALASLDGVGPAILPMARLALRARSWFAVEAAFAGLGTRPTVATTAGNARVAQQYGILGGCIPFRSDQRLWPFLAVSAGVLHTSVAGQGESPRQGHTVDKWSFLLDGSLGTGLRLPDRYYLTLAAHVQVADPYVAIHIVDRVVATTGRPNFVLTLTVGAWL
jgi:hypothetical protein